MYKHVITVAAILAPATTGAACVQFQENLKYGSRSQDVITLQKILNSNPQTQLNAMSTGGNGLETPYFGAQTHRAVIRFQNLYKSEILTPAGLARGNGVVGERTRRKLESLSCTLDLANKSAAAPATTPATANYDQSSPAYTFSATTPYRTPSSKPNIGSGSPLASSTTSYANPINVNKPTSAPESSNISMADLLKITTGEPTVMEGRLFDANSPIWKLFLDNGRVVELNLGYPNAKANSYANGKDIIRATGSIKGGTILSLTPGVAPIATSSVTYFTGRMMTVLVAGIHVNNDDSKTAALIDTKTGYAYSGMIPRAFTKQTNTGDIITIDFQFAPMTVTSFERISSTSSKP
jgi:peptidoglycan hydrolase-like protein with peptidoglycan-binding domain